MEKTVIKTGKTVDEAIEAALSELGCTKEQATIEVVEEGTEGGFLGLGRKDAEVKVTFNSEESGEAAPAAESDDDTYFGDDESFEGDAVSEAEDAAANFVAEVLSGIGIHGNMDSYREDDTIFISVTGSDCGAAIGRHGETLEAISYMTNLIANKHSEQRVHVYLDVGGYRKHREQVIKGLADKAVSRVRRSGRKVTMEAMSPAERRIVHSYLQDVNGVTTHSEGVEPNRCVVVTPEEKK
ncbi:MAG: protein jag [Clostridiales bacterium]|jgi:spoIIIJ-associated protein|nr:protein jag [Oscillospiraceae bacterium]MBQ1292644.1 protein jag [Clostridiales bacterium]MBQ1574333.1 protein jag [Clostridiales bacterium]MBQ5768218.1 protein jag [Clostridiales bacterium]MBR2597512.1 protein jag [Clostridiales bacterium]